MYIYVYVTHHTHTHTHTYAFVLCIFVDAAHRIAGSCSFSLDCSWLDPRDCCCRCRCGKPLYGSHSAGIRPSLGRSSVCRSVLVRFVIVLILFLIAHLQFFLKNNKIHRPLRGKVLHIFRIGRLGFGFFGCSAISVRSVVCVASSEAADLTNDFGYILENAAASPRSRHESSELIGSKYLSDFQIKYI